MNGHKTGVAKAKGAANLLMALQPYACGYLDRFMGGIGRHFLPPQGRRPKSFTCLRLPRPHGATMTDSPRSNPYAPGWSCPICGATNYYNCPNIRPYAFIEAVMHDPTVPIRERMRAADHLPAQGQWYHTPIP